MLKLGTMTSWFGRVKAGLEGMDSMMSEVVDAVLGYDLMQGHDKFCNPFATRTT